jgi:hypothetical protein
MRIVSSFSRRRRRDRGTRPMPGHAHLAIWSRHSLALCARQEE